MSRPPGGPLPRPGVPDGLRRSAAHVFCVDLEAPVLEADDAHHLSRVLRLRAGEPITVSDGRGRWRPARLALDGRHRVGLEALGPLEDQPAPAPALTLAVSLPKGDRADWAVQKLTEVGVDRLVVLASARSELFWVRPGADPAAVAKAMDRLARVVRAAAMQSRRCHLPELSGPVAVGEFIASQPESARSGAWAVADPDGAEALGARHSTVLVGPEGGWDPGEVPDHLCRVSLGPTVLRTETAAVVAAAALCLGRAGALGGS